MRAPILILIFLTLALNGIACACPTDLGDSGDSTHAQHSGHQSDDAPAADCHGSGIDDNCKNDCDELTAKKAQRQAVAINHGQVESNPDLDKQVVDNSSTKSIWPTGSALRVLLYVYRRWCTDESPVALKDRMLH